MKQILLKLDETFFYKIKEDKARREGMLGHKLKWEDYIKLIFGFSHIV